MAGRPHSFDAVICGMLREAQDLGAVSEKRAEAFSKVELAPVDFGEQHQQFCVNLSFVSRDLRG